MRYLDLIKKALDLPPDLFPEQYYHEAVTKNIEQAQSQAEATVKSIQQEAQQAINQQLSQQVASQLKGFQPPEIKPTYTPNLEIKISDPDRYAQEMLNKTIQQAQSQAETTVKSIQQETQQAISQQLNQQVASQLKGFQLPEIKPPAGVTDTTGKTIYEWASGADAEIPAGSKTTQLEWGGGFSTQWEGGFSKVGETPVGAVEAKQTVVTNHENTIDCTKHSGETAKISSPKEGTVAEKKEAVTKSTQKYTSATKQINQHKNEGLDKFMPVIAGVAGLGAGYLLGKRSAKKKMEQMAASTPTKHKEVTIARI